MRSLLPNRLLLNSISVSGERGEILLVSRMGLGRGVAMLRANEMRRAKVKSGVTMVNFILKIYDLDVVMKLGWRIYCVETPEIRIL